MEKQYSLRLTNSSPQAKGLQLSMVMETFRRRPLISSPKVIQVREVQVASKRHFQEVQVMPSKEMDNQWEKIPPHSWDRLVVRDNKQILSARVLACIIKMQQRRVLEVEKLTRHLLVEVSLHKVVKVQ
jgi:hypothetical protein